MNKKILGCSLAILFAFSLASCKKDEEPEEEKYKALVTCTKTINYVEDGMSIDQKVTAKVNFDNFVYWDEYTTVEKISNNDDYEQRKDFLQTTNTTTSDGTETKYEYDDNKKEITSVISGAVDFTKIDETHKQYLKAIPYITNSEAGDYKCVITGATKEELNA